MKIVAGIMALLVVGNGCAVVSTPTASPSGALSSMPPTERPEQSVVPPSPTTAEPASPSPSPSFGGAPGSPPPSPTRRLARSASVEQDGIRVRIELERNPMPAGEVTHVTTTVRNTGDRPLHWTSDGCSTPVHVSGELSVAWRPGIEQAGQAAEFKRLVLDLPRNAEPPRPIIRFVPEALMGDNYGCGDVAIGHVIQPGAAIHETRAWNGMAALLWGPFPSGPVSITGTFGWFWRGSHEPRYPDIPQISVPLDAWVTGGVDDTWLSPPEVVDAALTDPDFLAYLDTQELTSGRAEILWYDPGLGAWEVGVLPWYETDPRMLHVVLVDPHTGAVTGTVDRPWDEEKDGFP